MASWDDSGGQSYYHSLTGKGGGSVRRIFGRPAFRDANVFATKLKPSTYVEPEKVQHDKVSCRLVRKRLEARHMPRKANLSKSQLVYATI